MKTLIAIVIYEKKHSLVFIIIIFFYIELYISKHLKRCALFKLFKND